jgi:hypothetical protein
MLPLIFLIGVSMSNIDVDTLDKKAINNLEAASIWLVTKVTGKLYSDSSYAESLPHDLVHKYKLALDTIPKVNAGPEILRYIIKSRGIYYDIILLSDIEHNDEIYEYWKFSITTKKWATKQGNECRFMITKAPDKKGERIILRTENHFFHSYEEDDIMIFNLDYKNLKLRYKLRPWYFKQCFENYPELTKEEIIILEDGSYKAVPYSPPSP